jgi:hypothetical protein
MVRPRLEDLKRMPCVHCGYTHPVSSLPVCQRHGCARPDCVHNPTPPHTIENSDPPCAGFQMPEGVPFEGGGGQFGGGGATGGW